MNFRIKTKRYNNRMSIPRALLLIVYLIFVLAPIYWMVITAFKHDVEITQVNNITYWPQNFTFDNFISLFNQLKFGTYLKNSIILSLSSAFIVVIYSILGGYGMARFNFKGKKVLIIFFLISQMIPIILITIPVYMLYGKINLLNKLVGLGIFYIIMNIPFCVITMISFFKRIPVALEEAARIDGCTKIQTLTKVVIPVLFPGIVAVFVFAFIGTWNDLMIGVIFTSTSSTWTIPVGLKSLIGKYNVKWGELMAGGVLALIPTIIMFAIVQKFIIEGLTAGSVKG